MDEVIEQPIPEQEDNEEVLNEKLSQLKDLILSSNYTVVFTGAGISTAASIPDYRGENGLAFDRKPMIVIAMQERELDYKMPTYSHVLLSELVKNDVVKSIVTSNHDNLHVKAGTPDDKVIDLFGNAYVEQCGKCKKLWRRQVIVPSIGRKCDDPDCGGKIAKTQTRMNGQTPEIPLKLARKEAKKADLVLVFGSSMTISPFCVLPELAKKFVICNLQPTPYDDKAAIVIHSRIDKVLRNISQWTNVITNEFIYRQGFLFVVEKTNNDTWKMSVISGRKSEQPQCIDSVIVKYSEKKVSLSEETYSYETSLKIPPGTELNVDFIFKDDYKVENKSITLSLDSERQEIQLFLEKKVSFE